MLSRMTDVDLDLALQNRVEAVPAKQYDYNSRYIRAHIFDNGEPVLVGKDGIVTINATRPDGEVRSIVADIADDGTVIAPVSYWMVEQDGNVMLDMTLMNAEGRKITTMSFMMDVEKSNFNEDEPKPDDPHHDIYVEVLASEAARKEAEKQREANETERKQSESVRQTDETARKDSESKRVAAETDRADAEALRVTAESARAKAESERAKAEQDRAANESTRKTDEGKRVSNETERVNAENLRKQAEKVRAENETVRKANEQDRIKNEAERVAFDQKVHQTQTEMEQLAVQVGKNESARQVAEEDRDKAEQLRRSAEAQRVTDETNRVKAESNRQQNESARVTAEDARDTAEQSRVGSETARKDDETTRRANESERIKAEQGRSAAEQERVRAEDVRIASEKVREANEADRVAAEKSRAGAISNLDGRVDNLENDVFSKSELKGEYYNVNVPENVKVAKINKIEGRTEKSYNAIKFPYSEKSYYANGVTFTMQDDGGIRLSGDSQSISPVFQFQLDDSVEIHSNEITFCAFCDKPVGAGMIYLQIEGGGFDRSTATADGRARHISRTTNFGEPLKKVELHVSSGGYSTDCVVYPMIIDGNVENPSYIRYFEGLRDTKLTGIRSVEANLFDVSLVPNTNNITNNQDGSITVSYISCSTGKTLRELCPELVSGREYYLNMNTTGFQSLTLEGTGDWLIGYKKIINDFCLDSIVSFYGGREDQYPSPDGKWTIKDIIISEENIPYVPHNGEVHTIPIPKEVQEMEGYGKSFTSMDFENHTDEGVDIELTGDESIYYYPYNSLNGVQFSGILDTNYFRNKNAVITDGQLDDIKMPNAIWIGVDSSTVYWIGILDILGFSADEAGIEKFKQWLRDRKAVGNPVKIRYKSTVKHIVTPISQYFPNGADLPVQGNGSVVFENEHKQTIPVELEMFAKREPTKVVSVPGGSVADAASQELVTRLNSETNKEIERINKVIYANKSGKVYSVRFTGNSAKGTREDDAVGMVAEVAVDDQVVRNDFDKVPFFDIPVCNAVWNKAMGKWVVKAYRGEPTFKYDGTNGHLMRECTPFYYKYEMQDNGDMYVSVTGAPLDGYQLAPVFKNDTDKVYMPCCFMGLDSDGNPTSCAGNFPYIGSQMGNMEKARLLDERAGNTTMAALFTDYLLIWVEFANRVDKNNMYGCATLSYNSETTVVTKTISNTQFQVSKATADAFVIGQTVSIGSSRNGSNRTGSVGIDNIQPDTDSAFSIITLRKPVEGIAVGDFLSSRMYENGYALQRVTKASSGSPVSNTNGKYPCVWRGKENPWGNGFDTICDVVIKRNGSEGSYSYKMWWLPNVAKYSNGQITEDYIESDFEIAPNDGYAKILGNDKRYPWLFCTKQSGASSNTFFGAYYYYPRYDNCAVRVGGYFSHWSLVGLFFYCFIPVSFSDINYAARLFVNP